MSAPRSGWCTIPYSRAIASSMTREVVEAMHLPRKFEATCRTYSRDAQARHARRHRRRLRLPDHADGPERLATSGISSSSSAMASPAEAQPALRTRHRWGRRPHGPWRRAWRRQAGRARGPSHGRGKSARRPVRPGRPGSPGNTIMIDGRMHRDPRDRLPAPRASRSGIGQGGGNAEREMHSGERVARPRNGRHQQKLSRSARARRRDLRLRQEARCMRSAARMRAGKSTLMKIRPPISLTAAAFCHRRARGRLCASGGRAEGQESASSIRS